MARAVALIPDHRAKLLTRLALTDFRSYETLLWQPSARLLVLHGPNGSGKTNLLEAVSLLVPGRGLRGARGAELARVGGGGAWAVAAHIGTPGGDGFAIGTGVEPGSERRQFRLDGAAPRNQAEIGARLAAVWLTPQMDRLFQEGASGRRRFLDRLVFALEPAHAREIAAHETAIAQRNRLLTQGRGDAAWFSAVEDAITRHAVAATVARASLVARLNAALAAGVVAPFPEARLTLHCPIADRLAQAPALATEDWLRAALAASRSADRNTGASSLGAHRADMGLADAAGLPASRASTGQQKAMLLAVVLGHAVLMAGLRGFSPLLLLDEPLTHLDAGRRAALFAMLGRLPAQALLTGTDREAFADLGEGCLSYRLESGKMLKD